MQLSAAGFALLSSIMNYATTIVKYPDPFEIQINITFAIWTSY